MNEKSQNQGNGVYDNGDLRAQAEFFLRKESEDIAKLNTAQIEELVHELRVHQIELEMQNDNLQATYDELEKTLDEYADFYDNSPVGYVSSNIFGTVQRANKTIVSLLETDISNILNTNLGAWCLNKDAFYLHCRELANKGGTLSCEIQMKTSSNTILQVGIDSKLILREQEEPEIRSVITNVSEKRQLEEIVRQNERLESIGTLAGGIAHDFNNMLVVITGNISYALSRIRDVELTDVLGDAHKSAKQAQTLTQQLLTFAKGGSPVKKAADINQIVAESAKFVSRGGIAKCEFDFSNELWAAEVDEGQISQVVANLVINANQAMSSGGTITIRTENLEVESGTALPLPSGRYIEISVEDEGPGIPKELLPKIFDPYFTTKPNGSGLGLAITFSIIKHHGGHISVDSKPGTGTSCQVFLPASFKETKTKENVNKSHHGHGWILVMDDQKDVLTTAERLLKYMGYNTVLASDGAQAIAHYRDAYQTQNAFSLVILDLTVPGGMGGVKTLNELQKINPDVKAVVSSGYSTDPIMANYEVYGFAGVVPKPYSLDRLEGLLNDILG